MEYLKTTTAWRGEELVTPVIVFDQFEEIFTLQSAKVREEVIAELAPVVRGIMPKEVKTKLQEAEPKPFGEKSPEVKFVFSLREEFVGQLQRFAARIPAILDNVFLLGPLSREAAEDALTKPALHKNPALICPPFDYDKDELGSVIDFLKGRSGEVGEDGTESEAEIEPFQLQVIAQAVERRLLEDQSTETQSRLQCDWRVNRRRPRVDCGCTAGSSEERKASRE